MNYVYSVLLLIGICGYAYLNSAWFDAGPDGLGRVYPSFLFLVLLVVGLVGLITKRLTTRGDEKTAVFWQYLPLFAGGVLILGGVGTVTYWMISYDQSYRNDIETWVAEAKVVDVTATNFPLQFSYVDRDEFNNNYFAHEETAEGIRLTNTTRPDETYGRLIRLDSVGAGDQAEYLTTYLAEFGVADCRVVSVPSARALFPDVDTASVYTIAARSLDQEYLCYEQLAQGLQTDRQPSFEPTAYEPISGVYFVAHNNILYMVTAAGYQAPYAQATLEAADSLEQHAYRWYTSISVIEN